MFRKIVTYLTIYSFLYSNVCFAAMITPDGRTQTTVNVNGSTYHVNTSTTSGQNAFNSFTNFDVYQGKTVNLYLPGNTLNLINLVRDKKTNIDGILNSIKNGRIGGNVFILNPHGVAIGQNGVVNVGSLMLSTPNKEFMNQVIAPDGSISDLAVKSVLAGDLPINPAGVVSVKGKVKALDSVSVKGGKVVNAGEILANLKPTQASDILNVGGVNLDAPLVFKDGKIGVFAENDVVNRGKIAADATGAAPAGRIVIKAKQDIDLQSGSLISARGSSQYKDGGSVTVFADNRAVLRQGAAIAADAYDAEAAGGFAELSALKEVDLAGGILSAGGRDGMILIDPDILNITSDSIYSGNDNIYALAKTINVKKGVSLVKKNGNITLIARDIDVGWIKDTNALLNIEDNAILKGKNIYLYALAGDSAVLDGYDIRETASDNGTSATSSLSQTIKAKALEIFDALTDKSLAVGFSNASAEAKVKIGKNVTIEADEKVQIDSKVLSTSEVSSLGVGIDVVVAENEAVSGIYVDSGTQISGKDVSLLSDIDSSTSAEATTASLGEGRGVPVDIAVAVGITDTTNKIDIKNGVKIKADNQVDIKAETKKSHKVAAEGLAYENGWAAAGVAYSNSHSESDVNIGGTIDGKSINIGSEIRAVKNASSAKSTVGTGIFDRIKVWSGNKMLDALSKWITKIPAQTHKQSNTKLALSGAVSYSEHDNRAAVKVFNNYAEGENGAKAGTTSLSGNTVTISAHVLDMITNGAGASVSPKTKDKDHSEDQNKENSFAGAVGYGVYHNDSFAEISGDVAVDASESLELTSNTEQPVGWPDVSIFDVFKDLSGDVIEKGEMLLTNIEEYLDKNPLSFYTSLVKSSANTSKSGAEDGQASESGVAGIAGSVNIMKFNDKADAIIADGARINQKYNPENGGAAPLEKAPSVIVDARSYIETLNVSGEYGGAAKYGLGGSYLQTWYDSKVNALIGNNVRLYGGSLDVNAAATHRNLSLAATAGYKKSDTFGFQGSFDWLKSDSTLLAQIEGNADVLIRKGAEESSLTVNADSTNQFVTVAGGLVRGSQVGTGASGALNDITQTTQAVIGNLADAASDTGAARVRSDADMTVKANNRSALYAVSAAGALITQDKGQDNGQQNFGLGLSGTASYNTVQSISKAYVNNAEIDGSNRETPVADLTITSHNDSDILTVGGAASFVKQSDTNIGIAGAVGINELAGSQSMAFIDNGRILGVNRLSVDASATGNIIAAAESAAGAFGKTGITIAGAVSVNGIDNLVSAYVSNSGNIASNYIRAQEVLIKADNDSDIFALAGNISAGSAGGVGTSIAVNNIDNTVDSFTQNGDIFAGNGNVMITADNTAEIETSSAGVAYGGKAGISGSVSVNTISNHTRAYADNSSLLAKGSVLLKSAAASIINFYGGMIALATKGIGGGGTVSINSVNEDTLAEIRNNSTVKANGYAPAKINEQKIVTGVGVLAANDSTVNLYAVNAGLGKTAGIGANVAVSNINNQAVARIADSQINQGQMGVDGDVYNNAQQVTVSADNQTRLETHAGTVGASGTIGVGLSSATTLVENTTTAEIVNSQVKAQYDLAVRTDAKTYYNSVVVGGAGGKVGVAGNVNVAEINNHNHALIDGSTIVGYGNTTVEAKDTTRLGKRLKDNGIEEDFAVALGAGGVGLYNGTGASVLVSDIHNDTLAKIGNSLVDIAQDLIIRADSKSSILSYVVAAGLGLYSGVAGSIAVNSISNDTEAYIAEDSDRTTQINQKFGQNSRDVTVSAVSEASITDTLGAAAGGVGSGGASVDVSTIDGKTVAGTVGKLALDAGRDVKVTAKAQRDLRADGIAGAGGAGTLAGAILIARVGSDYTDEMQAQTAGVSETVNREIARNKEYQESLNFASLTDDVQLSGFDRDVNNEFAASVDKETGTSAYIGAGSMVKATGNVAVTAEDRVTAHSLAGQVSAGAASAGASVAVTDIRNAANAYIAGNSRVTAGRNLNLKSLTYGDINSKAMGGVVAAMFAAGGAVVHVDSDNVSHAYIGNGAVINADKVEIDAADQATVETLAAGAEAALMGAAGASVAMVDKRNDVRSFVGDAALIVAANLTGKAGDKVAVNSGAIAGAAGVIGAEGTYAGSSIVSRLKSYVGNAILKLTDNFKMNTAGSSHGHAGALGVNAGVFSVGASVADSKVDIDNQAAIAANAELNAKDIYLAAGQLEANATADSLAAAGALVGGNAAVALTDIGGTVKAGVEDGAQLKNAENVTVLSVGNSGQSATVSAYRGGLLAAGAAVAQANGHLNTLTEIGAVNLTADKLTAKAEAEDIIYAEAVSGSGGIISGAAAVATTQNDARTRVTLGSEGKNGRYDLKSLELAAVRTVKQNGFADSINASAVGASGARIDNRAIADTAVTLQGNGRMAVNDVNIKALNSYDKNQKFGYNNGKWVASDIDYNIRSGSGGVIDAPAVISQTVIDNQATVNVGSGITVARNQTRKAGGEENRFVASALNDVKAVDKAKLVSGGILAIADTISVVDNRQNKAAVNMNGNVTAAGDMILAANSNADLSAEVYVNTYGISGVAAGQARARTMADNSVNFGKDSYTMSYGDLYAYAGQAHEDYSGRNKLNSRVYLWNNTLLPFSAPEVEAQIDMNNLIQINRGAKLSSGRDINLTANMGVAVADGLSSAKNPYNQLLSLEDKVFNGTVGNNSRIVVDGTAEAGVNNIQSYIIDPDGRLKVTIGDESFYDDDQLYHHKSNEKLYSSILEEITRLKNLRADYVGDSVAVPYYDEEIAALQAKLALMGLYSENTGTINTMVDYITLDNIYAQPGAINLNTEKMLGSGLLAVTSDAAVTVKNNSSSFLRISDIIIPERSGGTIKLKGAAVTGDIDTLKVVINDKKLGSPVIDVSSDIAAQAGRAPNIDIDGTLSNYGGDILLQNTAGSIYVIGTISGKNLKIEAGRDVYQGYSDGFRHIGGDPSSAWETIASGNESSHFNDKTASASSNVPVSYQRSSLTAGNNIFISGRYVNLNGLVQSGTSDYNLNIGDSEIQLNGGLTSATALADYNRNKQYDYNASPLYKLSDKYGNIDAYYNAVEDRIELADVRVEGGYVEIYGHILNTAKNAGEIMVTDGYGRVNINNTSGKEIVVNNLSLANRISGVIKITDLAKNNGRGEFLQTTYTRNGNQITMADNAGTVRHIDAVQDQNGKSGTVYTPEQNQRYVWTTGQKSTTETTKTYQGESFWGMDWLVPDTGKGVTVTGPTPVGDPVKLANGERIDYSTSDNLYEYNKKSYSTSEDELVYHNVETWSDGWWIFSVDRYKVTDVYRKGDKHVNTHSIKADYDIKVSFKGYDSALADIISKSDITLNGVINNQGGLTSITTDGAVNVGSDYARVLGQGLNITAAKGIGSEGTALAVDIVNGNLNVHNRLSGNVNLKTAGTDLIFNTIINDGGNTSVSANGSIRGASADSLVKGRQISLTAATGTIGTDAAALKIQTSGGEDSSLSALANGNINLVQENGDLGLNSVVSLDGDITVRVSRGSVFDANTNEVYDNKTAEQLTKIWDDLGLDAGNAEMTEAYLNSKKAEYNAYWQYKLRQAESGEPQFKFTAAEKTALLNKQLNESEKQAVGSDHITEEYITRLEAEKTAEYKKLAAVYGDTDKYGSVYNADWQYQPDAAETAALAEGAGWNSSQLAYSIFKARDGEIVDTQYMIEDPNLSGRNVTVEAAGAIGRDEGSVVIKLSELSLTGDVDKKLLIASAERDNLEISADGDTITVHKREDVDVHADSINLKANGYIYLGGEQDINVNTVEAGVDQKITIAGAKGIYNVSTLPDRANIIGGDLILEAADGSVGHTDKALNLKLADSAKLTVRSQNNVFLNSMGDSLLIDSIFAKDGLVRFTSVGRLSALTRPDSDTVNIQGQSIVLQADALGTEDDYLTLVLGNAEGKEHSLTVTTAGDANIDSRGIRPLQIKSAHVGETLRLKSAASVVATDDSLVMAKELQFNQVAGDIGTTDRYLKVAVDKLNASAEGNIWLDNQRTAVFRDINAGGDIIIRAATDLHLNDVTSGRNLNVEAVGALKAENLLTGADILLTAGQQAEVITAGAQGNINLISQQSDVRSQGLEAGQDLRIAAANIEAANLKVGGDLEVRSAGDVFLREAETAGKALVGAGDNLTVAMLTAGKTVDLTAATADLEKISADGDIAATVAGDNLFGSLTSTAGNISLVVDGADVRLRGPVKAGTGKVKVLTRGSILNSGAPAEGAIIANIIDLTAQNGSIGHSDNYLTVDSSYSQSGWIDALAEKGIYIREVNGDMNIGQFVSASDIDMRVESSIQAAPGHDPNLPNFKANNVTLHSRGMIGTPENRLVIALNDDGNGRINLQANRGIGIRKLGTGLISDYMRVNDSGKILIELPSGHAQITSVQSVDGFELALGDEARFYNIRLGISDIEAKMMNPPYLRYPAENPVIPMSEVLAERYRIQPRNSLFLNLETLEKEQKFSDLLF